MLTFPVATGGYISSPESASVPRESAKEIMLSFLLSEQSAASDTPANNGPSNPVKLICRCVYNGSAYDVCDNTAIDKTVETLAD